MKLGRGWAPEPEEDEVSLFAIRELRMLLAKIFEQRQRNFREHDNTRTKL